MEHQQVGLPQPVPSPSDPCDAAKDGGLALGSALPPSLCGPATKFSDCVEEPVEFLVEFPYSGGPDSELGRDSLTLTMQPTGSIPGWE